MGQVRQAALDTAAQVGRQVERRLMLALLVLPQDLPHINLRRSFDDGTLLWFADFVIRPLAEMKRVSL